jgi:hypothetical protein
MDISFLPTEILLHIFAIIHDDFGRDSRATLAALARTCRTFEEPALDTLWRNIDGLKPIVSCMPEFVVVQMKEGKLVS